MLTFRNKMFYFLNTPINSKTAHALMFFADDDAYTHLKSTHLTPYPHQIELCDEGLKILGKYHLVYIAMEERTGKTLTSIMMAERTPHTKVLVVTKKKALDGWNDTLERYPTNNIYMVTNYHQVSKLKDTYDLIILDEAHNYISGYPKPSAMCKQLRPITEGKPIIYLSATAYAQGYQLLYYQLALSSWSPWNTYNTFYAWFKDYGVPEHIYISGRRINKYDKTQEDKIKADIDPFFLTRTRTELSFPYEPIDVTHYIDLETSTKDRYNLLLKDRLIPLGEDMLVADTMMKLRVSLHMLEGGVAKIDKKYIVLNNREKIDFILGKWGDTPNIAIMYNYIAEKTKLEQLFKHAILLQATSNAEGIELSHIEHLIIYSQDFSTARHAQRRARQASKQRTSDIYVHYLLVKDGISDQVYYTVSINKVNFIDSLYIRRFLDGGTGTERTDEDTMFS